MKKRKFRLTLIVLVSALFVLAFVLTAVFPNGYLIGGDYEYLISLLLAFAILFWGISMIDRAQFKTQRTYIVLLVVSFFFWVVLRFIKWLPNIHFVSIYADYLYYVPMLLIPLLFFMMTLETFYPDLGRKKVLYALLWGAALTLIALVLTNDLHFLVYKNFNVRHGDNPNIEIITSEYGPLHYVALSFVGLLALSALSVFVIGSRKQLSWKQVLIVGAAFLLLALYVTLFELGLFSAIPILRDFATSITLLLMAVLEALIDIGLIQNNGKYEANFKKALLDMTIYDENGKVLYKTDTVFSGKEINKSIGFYRYRINEDLSGIAKLQADIQKGNEDILEANKNLEKLIEISKEEVAIDYRLRLTSEIENSIEETKQEILSLAAALNGTLDEEAKKTLGYIAMLLGYMKQKCMLLLRAKEETKMTREQAKLLMDVISKDLLSVDYEDVAINLLPGEGIDISFASSVNDFIHQVAKAYRFSKASLLITVNPLKNACKIAVFGENIEKKEIALNAKVAKDEEGVSYLLEASHG